MKLKNTVTKLNNASIRKQSWIFAFLSLLITLIFNYSIFSEYIFLDATEYIWTANRISSFHDEFIQGGRPLLGMYCEFIYGTMNLTISDLKWIRLFSIICSIIFSMQVFYFLRKNKMYFYESAIFAFLILTLPSFSVYFSWSATSEIPFLLNINFFAGVLLLKNLKRKKGSLLYYIIPLTLIILSLCMYQSTMTAFLIPIVAYFILTQDLNYKKVGIILLFMFIAFVLYFFIFKYSLFLNKIQPSDRTQLNLLELPKNLIIFYLREIRVLVQGSGLLVTPILFFVIGTTGFLGFLYKLYKRNGNNKASYFFISCVLLVLPLSYLPNLLSTQNYFCARAIAPTAILVLLYQFLFFRDISIKKKIFKKISLAIVVSLFILSSINLNYFITRIQIKEYSALKTAFLEIPYSNKKIILIQPGDDFLQKHNFYKNKFADEFGNITSSRAWAPSNLFKQVLKEYDEELKFKNILVIKQNEKFESKNTTVINMVEVLKKEFSKPR